MERFEDLKFTIQGQRPSYDFLSQDFDSLLNNSKLLMEDVATVDGKCIGLLGSSENEEETINFQHVVFEVFFFFNLPFEVLNYYTEDSR